MTGKHGTRHSKIQDQMSSVWEKALYGTRQQEGYLRSKALYRKDQMEEACNKLLYGSRSAQWNVWYKTSVRYILQGFYCTRLN